ncbi:hypothetical protein EHI8A_017120 [Entamoeba histolytica HM-1:IMSS-B]|uniref:Queuosine 5'-phosphate N-glycosylase/hydrolase n=7 Tax=Entamoeba histolytica TaxID=5759 RepID=C4LXA2_ENTH1|nr:hypothetical protein EHI_098190 [Entamoeba histolytica HM-1:IMSS]EMD47399.1 cytoplasmic protein of eukaryotic origin (38.3 kD) family protein [Entamoeba histolytica KU27]EMH78121.1 hypothetical protein EHI8A_017120 [Entamoeba histolytica HM-1:IMSS-B]EMS11092.1 cytoplasmic protein of eukaryotic origin (38.3 kD)-like family protein [Entamoeba histolytica HM-3:IMSS]ENY62631.1 hypothetical protein EHI7A_020700 [Entamoeba histolytica HM-1:IMSS-A]BAN38325.1 hypothetical protein [Entamoeba histoly|eukprot:XP_653631.1 hypothetical protein EHI_098190 [Entamoeba histolytica HM-1:IMSS]
MCEYVRWSVDYIEQNAKHVRVNQIKLKEKIIPLLEKIEAETFDESIHQAPNDIESRLRYILVVDALNFCFWPTEGFEYDDLTKGLSRLEHDHPEVFEPNQMKHVSSCLLSQYLVYNNRVISNIEERTRLMREVGEVLCNRFDQKVLNLLEESKYDATTLVSLIAKEFPGFRDSTIYKGRQVFFYKRAQIVVSDIQGMCGCIKGLEQLTGFADYRIPQVLLGWDVLDIEDQLKQKILDKKEIPSGSEEEIEIRCTVLSAIKMIQAIFLETKNSFIEGYRIDWFLWSYGEKNKEQLPPHHRTQTIFY